MSLPRPHPKLATMIRKRSNGQPRSKLSLAVCVIPLSVYLRTLTPIIILGPNWPDGGDVIPAVATLGIPHSTDYPTYVLLGRLFPPIPRGTWHIASI